MPKIICIGSACQDIFFPTLEGTVLETPEDLTAKSKIAFELGAKYKIEERYEALGGCTANVACGLAKLETQAACYSHIGDDAIARWIMKELKKNGVNTDLIIQEKNCPSDMSAIVVDEKSAERVIFSNQTANGKLEIIPDKLKSAEWLFMGDLHGDWENHLETIFKTARENNIPVAYNPRQANINDNPKKVIEFIRESQILFLNKDETITIILASGEKYSKEELNSEKFLIKKLNQMGAKIVAITDGIRGAWAADEKETFFAPAVKVKALDSTGAGDSFGSGFLAAYVKGKSLGECLKWGIANSTSVVQFYGAIEGILKESEIEKRAKLVETRNL